jgi:hypothetical protein
MYGDSSPLGTNVYGSQAAEAWAAGNTGNSSVVVGIIDEGIDFNHPDLADNIWTNPYDPVDGIDNDGNGYVDDIHGWDFFHYDNTIYDGQDDHGTHVAGTIGAAGGNGIGVAGVNWDVTMIAAKFLGPNGGYISDAIRALDYLTDLKTRHGINIVAANNSWGGGGFSQSMLNAITRAAQAGVLFVAAAGNGGSDGRGDNNDFFASYPANYSTAAGAGYDSVISVAAITSSGALASFSNYGSQTVDLGAPGVSILSTVPGGYAYYSGTSMATPHVTGAIALYAAAHPGATAQAIKAAILESAAATPTASLAGKTLTGGRLNLGAAPSYQPSLSINNVSLAEGNSGTKAFTFTVVLSPANSDDTVTVAYATANGSAEAGSDYQDASGTLTFGPGQTTQTLTVWVSGDATGEPSQTFYVNLSGATGAVIADAQGVGTILNDDASLSINNVSVTERNSGSRSANFTVTLSQPLSQTVTVQYATANGTATAPSDYTAKSGSLTFNPGQTSKTISVSVRGDRTVEPNEVFFLNLSNAAGVTIADGQGQGTILNDDATRRTGGFLFADTTSRTAASEAGIDAARLRADYLDLILSSSSVQRATPRLHPSGDWLAIRSLDDGLIGNLLG